MKRGGGRSKVGEGKRSCVMGERGEKWERRNDLNRRHEIILEIGEEEL